MASKNIENRIEFQERFKTLMIEVNNRYERHIMSKFMLSFGYGFQGVLTSATRSFEIADYLQRRLYPKSIRIGIGLGELSTKVDPDMVSAMDGVAFDRAREVLSTLRYKSSIDANVCFFSGRREDLLINAVLYMCSALQENWTERQREFIHYMLEAGASQKDTAKHFRVLQSTVSRTLKCANFGQYIYCMKMLQQYTRNGWE